MLGLDLDDGVPEWVADVEKSRHNWHGGVPLNLSGCAKYIVAMALGSDPKRECFNIFMCLNGIDRGYLSVWHDKPSKCDDGIPEWCRPIVEMAMKVREAIWRSR